VLPRALGRPRGSPDQDGSRRRDVAWIRPVAGGGFDGMMGIPSIGWNATARVVIATAALLGPLTGAAAADDVYTYRIHHPTFGDIGRYVDRVSRRGDEREIVSQLRVAVRVLGIVLHREEADRTEIWRAGRLVHFQGVTTTNGDRIEVRGEARDGEFVVTTPSGVKIAPPDVIPSNPWSARSSAAGVMMSTKTGRLETVADIKVEDTVIPVLGVEVPTRHFVISTDKRQDVWKDARGVPVEFRTAESVGSIDFILIDQVSTADAAHAAAPAPADEPVNAASSAVVSPQHSHR